MQILKSHVLASQVKKNFLNGYSKEVVYRFEKLEFWENLKEEGCDEATIFQVLKVSRATIFRWQKLYQEHGPEGLKDISRRPSKMRIATQQNEIRNAVFKCRKKYPLFGKYKIKIMLQEDYGVNASVSTIGLVISKLIKFKKILHVNDVCGKRIRKQWRQFDDHAKRFQFGMKANRLGEMIQVDHMTEGSFKHFAAICPISKLVFTYAYRQATALTAAGFLRQMLSFFPFKVVDSSN